MILHPTCLTWQNPVSLARYRRCTSIASSSTETTMTEILFFLNRRRSKARHYSAAITRSWKTRTDGLSCRKSSYATRRPRRHMLKKPLGSVETSTATAVVDQTHWRREDTSTTHVATGLLSLSVPHGTMSASAFLHRTWHKSGDDVVIYLVKFLFGHVPI